MRVSRREFAQLVCALSMAFAASIQPTLASDAFPTRPIKLLVPYAAGGGTDAIARLVAQAVGETIGQTIVVENNGQAGGNIVTQQAANAAPDGYTILMANQGPMVVNPHLFKSVKVDPLKAFAPITLIASAPLFVVVPKGSRFKSIKDLVEFSRANPNKLSYGSAGNGSASHLATVLFTQKAKFSAVHVPYRGAGPAINDLLGGQLDFMITTVPSVLGQIEGNLVSVLGVTSAKRMVQFPDVPTVAENGWPDYTASAWYGFAAPTGTPLPRIKAIRDATLKAIGSPLIKSRLEKEGAEPIGNLPEDFAEMMKRESAMWADVIKTEGIALN